LKKIIFWTMVAFVIAVLIVSVLQILGFNLLMAAAETRITGLWLLSGILLLILTIVVLVWVISIFNSLIQVRNNIMKAWKNIDVVLLQRHDELSKLVEAFKIYTDYEQHVLLAITQLRVAYRQKKDSAQKTTVENDLNFKANDLFAGFEKYPELKANENSVRIMDSISSLESIIAGRRVFFNDTVKVYNAQIETFPYFVFAGIMGLRSHPYLDDFETAEKFRGNSK